MIKPELSIVIPAKNELAGLSKVLPDLRGLYPDVEIIVVDDGSSDDISSLCEKYEIKVVRHPYSKGNGAAIKSGARESSGELIVFMDADGQHNPADIKILLEKMNDGFDMVVGARSRASQASFARYCANSFYNLFATFMVGQHVDDLTSGFRVVRAKLFKQLLHLLPNSFSYPTTSTMAFFRSGYNVGYVPIVVNQRIGTSHIKLLRDGGRFLLILFKIGTLFSPLKIFVPVSAVCFLTGVSYYIFTFITMGRFTNMSALLFSTSVIVFLMGLVSEQITSLIYSQNNDDV